MTDKISELKVGTNTTIEGEVVSIDPSREVRTKFGKLVRVANATVSDGTGEVIITLWEADIDKVNIGDKIKLENGWVSEFKGNVQVTIGKQGKIEVLGADSSA